MSSPFAMPAEATDIQDTLLFDFDVVVGTTSALVAISTIAVALRVLVRTRMTKTFGLDDCFMVAAWAVYMVTAALTYASTLNLTSYVKTGTMRVAQNTLVQLIRYGNAAYAMTMLMVKISLGLFFLKLFATSTNYKWQRISIWVLMGLSTVMGVVYLIMTIATCGIMIQSQKTTPMRTGSDWCPIQQTFVNVSIAWSFLNSISDFVFTGLGVWALIKAKMSPAAKLSAGLLLAFGSIGVVASCARIAVQLPVVDISVSGILLVEWSNIEAGVCVIAGSLVTLRPLYQRSLASARSTLASFSRSSHQKSADGTQSASSTCSKCAQCAAREADSIEKGQAKGIVVTTTHSLHSKNPDDDLDDDISEGGHKSTLGL